MLSFIKNIFTALAFLCLSVSIYAQQNQSSEAVRVRGSGRIVQEQRTLKHFSSLEIDFVSGDVSVEAGGIASGLEMRLDDNLKPLLRIEERDGKLKLFLRDEQGRPVWTTDVSVAITIKTPSLKGLVYNSNGTIKVSGLQGNSFSLVNKANGSVNLGGKVNSIDIVSAANGEIDAEALVAARANVVCQANASVRVNSKELNTVKTGHGNVTNVSTKH